MTRYDPATEPFVDFVAGGLRHARQSTPIPTPRAKCRCSRDPAIPLFSAHAWSETAVCRQCRIARTSIDTIWSSSFFFPILFLYAMRAHTTLATNKDVVTNACPWAATVPVHRSMRDHCYELHTAGSLSAPGADAAVGDDPSMSSLRSTHLPAPEIERGGLAPSAVYAHVALEPVRSGEWRVITESGEVIRIRERPGVRTDGDRLRLIMSNAEHCAAVVILPEAMSDVRSQLPVLGAQTLRGHEGALSHHDVKQ